jgi:M6 family metalloprotease-like protein
MPTGNCQSHSKSWLRGLVLVLSLWSSSQALIVVDGKIVPAWPDTGAGSMPRESLSKSSATEPPFLGQYLHPKGTFYGLTLVVDFSDQAPAFTKTQVENWLNQKGFAEQGIKGSVRDYYLDVSHGQFDFINEVHGIYRAKNPKSYYEGGNGYERGDEFLKEVLAAFDAEVDFSKFDNNGDGVTESISILYAGTGETWGQGLWPHAGGVNQKRDGVTVSRYMMTDMQSKYSLYVFSHECGHMIFGWPDLYGVGDYCLMANRMSEMNPVPINDFYRADQGWIPVVDIKAGDNWTLTAKPDQGGFRFLNPANSKECFFWSNVKNTGRWSTLKGKGLLLWHFDKTIGTNDPPKTLGLSVVQADGKTDLNATMWPSPGSDAKDFFFAGNLASFSSTTNPKSNWNNGTASNLNLHDISAASDSMTFMVGVGVDLHAPLRRVSRKPDPLPNQVRTSGPNFQWTLGRNFKSTSAAGLARSP